MIGVWLWDYEEPSDDHGERRQDGPRDLGPVDASQRTPWRRSPTVRSCGCRSRPRCPHAPTPHVACSTLPSTDARPSSPVSITRPASNARTRSASLERLSARLPAGRRPTPRHRHVERGSLPDRARASRGRVLRSRRQCLESTITWPRDGSSSERVTRSPTSRCTAARAPACS